MRTRRLDLVEDAVAEAFVRAAQRWPADGVPDDAAAWLFTVAHRHVLDRLRAEAMAGRKAPLLAVRADSGAASLQTEEAGERLPDERLHLVLLCCHPALPVASRAPLALRLVVGTSTEDIARLFLVETPTMAARLTRAKKKIVAAGVPLRAPLGEELGTRLDEVCRTVYLAFTAGYAPRSGPQLLRVDLAGEAVRLAAVLRLCAPRAPQVRALHALLLLQHARRDAREDDGRLVTLPEQDRSRWRADEIRAGLALLDGLPPTDGYAEELRLQALVAAEHVRAVEAEATDWVAVARHYGALERLTGSPVVRLNRAVAVAEVHGPAAGLRLLEGLDELLAGSHRLPAVRAELHSRAGDLPSALASSRAAVAACTNEVERTHLLERLQQIAALGGDDQA